VRGFLCASHDSLPKANIDRSWSGWFYRSHAHDGEFILPWYLVSHLDAEAEELTVVGTVKLAFNAIVNPAREPVAVVLAQTQVRCRPAIATSTNDTLQLQFRSAEVLGSASINIGDLATILLGGFGCEAGFRQAVAGHLNDIVTVSKTSPFSFVIPAWLESRPLPD